MVMKNALEQYRIEKGLSVAKLSRIAGFCNRSATWKHCNTGAIPVEAAVHYSLKLGIPLHDLRPDLPHPAAPEGSEEARG